MHAGRDDAADEATARVDDLDVGRRAEVDHDNRRPVEPSGGNGVGDAVGADLTRIGIIRLEKPRLFRDGRGANARLDAGVLAQRLLPRLGEKRHHRGERRRIDVPRLNTLRRQQRDELDVQVIGGIVLVGGDAPHPLRPHAVFSTVGAENGLSVSYINRK